jgi:cytochrome bd ubiquinol oxidase subunit I
MAMSLGFHIVFAAAGIALPLLMVISEALWLRTRKPVYLELTRRWAKGTAVLFAVGAVSGTVLSFELGLLWPAFMELAGPIIGMPFSLEGFAFFVEAVFLGIYLYGWDKIPSAAHWLAGVMVLAAGTASGVFVVAANGWMNAPAGFELVNGKAVNVDVWAAMFNRAAGPQALHMTVAAFQAVGFAAAGIHAYKLLKDRDNDFHRKAYAIALAVGAAAAVLQPLSGDYLAKRLAVTQPLKLAAAEGQWETQRRAPLRIGGWPDEKTETTPYALEIPGGLSFLARGDADAEVLGLKSAPPEGRPPVAIVHFSFQFMVAAGFLMAGTGLLGGALAWRKKKLPDQPWFLRLVVVCAPLGFLAIEAGWVVTEVGRQPWIIYNILRTADAVTPMPGLAVPFALFTVVYLFLAAAVILLLRRQVFESPTFPR